MLSRNRSGSSSKSDEKKDEDPGLSFSLPTSEFERFMLVKTSSEYLERLPMTAHFVTWNVSGQLPCGSLQPLFESTQRAHDLVVVALQHVPPPVTPSPLGAIPLVATVRTVFSSSSTTSSTSTSTSTSTPSSYSSSSSPSAADAADPDGAWIRALTTVLDPNEYTLVGSSSFATLLTCVFVHLRHGGHVRRVRTARVRCGPTALATGLGMGTSSLASSLSSSLSSLTSSSSSNPNASPSSSPTVSSVAGYGALAIRFQLYQSTFCILNTHLATAAGDVVLRNSDYAHVCRQLRFDLREGAERQADAQRQRRQQDDESLLERLQKHQQRLAAQGFAVLRRGVSLVMGRGMGGSGSEGGDGSDDEELDLDALADSDEPRPDGDDLIGGRLAEMSDDDVDDDDDDNGDEKQDRRSNLQKKSSSASSSSLSAASKPSSSSSSKTESSTSSSSSSSTPIATSDSVVDAAAEAEAAAKQEALAALLADRHHRTALPADPRGRVLSGAPQMARHVHTVWDHDHVIFMGGCNYRLDLRLSEALALLQRRDVTRLVGHDQLAVQRALGAAFAELVEPPIKINHLYHPSTSHTTNQQTESRH